MRNIFLLFFGFSFSALLLFNCTKYEIEENGKDFRVIFETNGGVNYISDQSVAYGERIKTMPTNPKKPGFIFDGWYYRDSNFFDSTKPILRQTTLYAKWVMSPKVYLYAESRGGTPMPKQQLIKDYELSLPFKLYPEPIKKRYNFKGWFYDTLGKDTFNFHIPLSADDTMFAYWDKVPYHTLTFINYSNVKKQIEIDTIYENEPVLPHSASPNTTDSFFEDWYSHPTQGKVPFQFKKSLTKNDTVYARFFKPQRLILTFEPNHGVMPTDQPFYFTGGLRIPELPTPYFSGKSFAGWFLDNNTFKERIDSNVRFYASATAYAKWIENTTTYTVTFEGSSPVPIANLVQLTEAQAVSPTKVDSMFVAWFTDAARTTQVVFPLTLTANTTLYPKFTAVAPTTYTVTFNLNYSGSTGAPANQTITSGANASTPTAPTRTGYTFNGWFAVTTGGTALTTLGPITGVTTYYAQWTAVAPTTYTVTFNLNYSGSTGAPANQTITSGLNASTPTAPTRVGYTFNGWFAATTDGAALTTLGPITAATTYYAQWTEVPCTEAYNRVLLNDVCYKTIVIGTQTWLAENLNDASNTAGESSCYDNNASNCTTYGRLYNWDAAVDIDSKIAGWHLPSDAEWTTLSDQLGGASSAAGDNMKVRGSSGFDALFAGVYLGVSGYDNMGSFAYFWSSTPAGSGNVIFRSIFSDNTTLDSNSIGTSTRFSVRLLKD